MASFVGFVPADDPELTALVILDSPEGDHSGSRAAGVFARILSRSLRYLGVPPDDDPPLRLAKIWPQSAPILGEPEDEPASRPDRRGGAFGARSVSGSRPDVSRHGGAPDVLGLAARDAVVRFVAAGVVPELVGRGWVVEQYPRPGEKAEPGVKAKIYLGQPGAKPLQATPEIAPGPGRLWSTTVVTSLMERGTVDLRSGWFGTTE